MDLTSQSHFFPHTAEAGDAYYFGDIYEPSYISQSGELIDRHLVGYKASAP